ncbi:N-acetylmuramoyl-L-alanine amidase [candidate division WOR-3 bacterium]|nr:N-acetylmuramoyl-L-alanine amidase [candidate division WOR-3 bacterium]
MLSVLIIAFLVSAPKLKIEYNGKSYKINCQIIDKFTYLSLKDLQPVFDFTVSENTKTKRFVLKFKEKDIILIPDNPWIKLGDKILNLPLSSELRGTELYVPLPMLNKILEYFLKKNIKIKGKKLIVYETGIRIKKIVIDPGHGGKDPGAIGHNGTYEKDIVLKIAKLVTKLIESELGVKCILTRDKDIFIPLNERTKLANDEEADLFLSIHCNAARSRRHHGTEMYFLSPAKTTWARAVEARENASLKYETPDWEDKVKGILWDMAQTEFLKESNTLSGKLLKSILESANTKDRGVRQANFFVLRGAYMPACLLELEFLSNLKGEKRLKTKEFQKQLAQGILKGVKEFKEWYEERMNK